MKMLKEIGKSIYSPEFYRDLLKKEASYSVKYFALVSLIFCTIFILRYGIVAIPGMNKAFKEIGLAMVENYPSELEVSFKGGKVSTNVEEPYVIKAPDSWKEEEGEKNLPENILVIDTKNEPALDSLKKYDSMVLLTEEYVIYEEEGKITTQSLEKFPDVVVNRQFVENIYQKYFPYLNLLIPIVLLMIFFGGIFYVILRIVYLIPVALLIWVVSKIKGVEMGYGKAYQTGLHLMTLPLLVGTLVPISFPFSFTLMLIVLAFFNIGKSPVEIKNNQSDEILTLFSENSKEDDNLVGKN